MKVVQIVPTVCEESSGPSYSVPRLCRGLVENGVETELHFLGKVPTRLNGEKFKVVNYPWHNRVNLGWSPAMKQGLCEICRTADILHNNSLWMMPNVYPAWAVKGAKCKLVVAPRGTLATWSLKKGWIKKKLFGLLLQNQVLHHADMFHATSEKEYEEIRALGYKQPVAIVPIGMEIPEVAPSKSGTEWGSPGLKKIVFFGRLHQVKAVDRLVQAWELLTQRESSSNPLTTNHQSPTTNYQPPTTNWELIIAGPDCGIRGELEQYIKERNIPRVKFVGEMNGQTKYDFLSAADVYVLPSFTENFGVTVAEALACGTPVIVSKGTPWRGVETLRNDGGGDSKGSCCGWWVENTPETLAKTIEEAVSSSDERRRQMGTVGREWIRRDFSWAGVGAKMKSAYEWLLNPGSALRPEFVFV